MGDPVAVGDAEAVGDAGPVAGVEAGVGTVDGPGAGTVASTVTASAGELGARQRPPGRRAAG
ncbi:hypothetical protein ND748_32490, partial [Frankia sp. AiPs1]